MHYPYTIPYRSIISCHLHEIWHFIMAPFCMPCDTSDHCILRVTIYHPIDGDTSSIAPLMKIGPTTVCCYVMSCQPLVQIWQITKSMNGEVLHPTPLLSLSLPLPLFFDSWNLFASFFSPFLSVLLETLFFIRNWEIPKASSNSGQRAADVVSY